jgi:hypothetical protein
MIGHQHKGMNLALVFLSCSGEVFEVLQIILLTKETRRFIVAALNDKLATGKKAGQNKRTLH